MVGRLPDSLKSFGFDFCAPPALINSNQLSLLDIELFFLEYFPFMKAAAA